MGERKLNRERDLTLTYLDLCDRNMGEGLVELEDAGQGRSRRLSVNFDL